MGKKLSEMSLDELWHLFPIYLTEHQDSWEKQYLCEENRLKNIFRGMPINRISHIGSTSVAAIWAKPIVDILIEVPKNTRLQDYADVLTENGYICMSQGENRISLNKGYTENGFDTEVFHLHLRYEGDNDELYFRDYLNAHPDVAKDYEQLKLSLWKKFEFNRDGYTDAKGDFIKKYTDIAKQEYNGKY